MREFDRDITVVIACSEELSVFDCIDSIGRDARIVVSMTPSDEIDRRLDQLQIPHVLVPRGNLGVTYNAGLDIAETNKVIIANDDTTFNPGAIDKLSDGLDIFDACKPRILFQYDEARPITRLVAQARDFANSSPKRAFTPGLAINRTIKDSIGGHYFNPEVKWAEDAEFSYRFKQSGLRFGYIHEATINHPPVTPGHDLRGAFLIGLSKRRAVDLGLRNGDEDFIPTMKRVFSGQSFERKMQVVKEKGTMTAGYMLVWDLFYNLGYSLRKYGASDGIEKKIWSRRRKEQAKHKTK